MKTSLLITLLTLSSCAHVAKDNKNYELKIGDETHQVSMAISKENIALSHPKYPMIVLDSTEGNDGGFFEDAFMGLDDVTGNRWDYKGQWIYAIFLTTPDSQMGKKMMSDEGQHECFKDKDNKYLVIYALGDMAGAAIGCIK